MFSTFVSVWLFVVPILLVGIVAFNVFVFIVTLTLGKGSGAAGILAALISKKSATPSMPNANDNFSFGTSDDADLWMSRV